MTAVLTIALPVFAVIAAGALAGRLSLLTASDGGALTKFVFRIAMPAALFGLTAGNAPPGPADAALAGAYFAAAALSMSLAYGAGRVLFSLPAREAGAHAFASTLGNAVFLGLPIVLNIEGWARPYVVLMLVEGIVVIAAGAALMAPRKEGERRSIFSLLGGPARNPLVVAALAGFLASLAGPDLPEPAAAFFDLLGRAAGPTALFALGLFLATRERAPVGAKAGRVGAVALSKLVVLPGLAFAAAHLAGVADADYRGALALFVLVPSGVGTFIMAAQYKVYETETAAAVLVTTLLSVLTVSGVLIAFQ